MIAGEQTTAEAFELAVPAVPQSVSVCRLFVASVARHFDIAEDAVGDLKVAVSEAVTNAIKAHKDAGREELPVRVRVACDDEGCHVEIIDDGAGFQAPTASAEAITPPAGLYEGSLGLLLIRALFPEAEIDAGRARGTTVRFTAKR